MERQICDKVDLSKIKVDDDIKLSMLLDEQRRLMKVIGVRLGLKELIEHNWDNDTKTKWLLKMLDCLHSEIEEFRDGLKWKHWKEYKDYSFEKELPELKYEAVDMLHFLLEIFIFLEMTPTEIGKYYLSKNQQNQERQANGY